VDASGVVYVHGDELAAWMRGLPPRVADSALEKLGAALAEAATAA
jgi:hypothetical protein